MSHSIHFRNLRFPDDLEALAKLKNTYFKHYGIDRVTDAEKQKGLLSYPNHDAEQDNFVAELSNDLVGHIWLWEQSPNHFLYDLHLHPQWERQGIGSQLMASAINRVRESDGHYIDTQISLENVNHIRFCHKLGFQPLGRYLQMQLPDKLQIPRLKLSDDFIIRHYDDINDIELYTRAMNQCYGDLWGHMSDASTELVAQSLNYFDASWIFFMFSSDDELVGFGRIFIDKDKQVYRVDAPGVMPAYRSPERYRELLLYSLNQLQFMMTEPQPIISDSWGDFDSTLNIFWELGFIAKQHKIGYRFYL